MADGTAEGGVISKEVKKIFQRVGEIVDENQKKNRAQNTALRNSSLDRKGHTLAATGEEVGEA